MMKVYATCIKALNLVFSPHYLILKVLYSETCSVEKNSDRIHEINLMIRRTEYESYCYYSLK